MLPVKGVVQKYAWGKPGNSSYVSKLLLKQGGAVSDNENYAELWFGDHPSGSSIVVLTDGSSLELGEYLSRHGEWLGPQAGLWENHMPFLFKVRDSLLAVF